MRMRLLTLLACCLPAACGGSALTTTPDGAYRIVAHCAPGDLTATLDEHVDATMVVCFDQHDTDVTKAAAAAKRSQRPFIIAIGSRPNDKATDIPDVTIVAESGAKTAVELALLASLGQNIPANRIEIGTTIITPANRAAGGTRKPAPGDAILAVMRMEHANRIKNATGSRSIGMIQTDPSSQAQTAAVADVQAASVEYRGINLLSSVVNAEQQLTAKSLASQLIRSGCRALILACSDPTTTKAVAATCKKDGNDVALIVLDPTLAEIEGITRIGCSAEFLGRNAAAQLPALLPEGGSLIACIPSQKPGQHDVTTRSRVQAFCDALGFDAERLLAR